MSDSHPAGMLASSAGRSAPTPGLRAAPAGAPVIDGKFLRCGGRRFRVRGVTYGTFAPGEHGLFPPLEQVEGDFAAMAKAGVNTVRTYTVPDRAVADAAARAGLRLLVGIWWDDPRYLDPPTPAAWRAMAARAREAVRGAARELGRHPALLAFVVGNEIPGAVVRWHGRGRVEKLLRELYATGKEVEPRALFAYASYPTTEYLDTSCFDLDCFNVFLESEAIFRRYLAHLQAERPARPVVLTELGLDSGLHGEPAQAAALDWQLRAAMEAGMAGTCVFSWTDEWWVGGHPVDGWSFGLTGVDRRPKPALEAVSGRYRAGLAGVRPRWPRVSVVVCAYRAEATIAECLTSLAELDYPDYEVLVVDDGSDDATAAIAHGFGVRVIEEGRHGLSGARNLGLEHASGEIVAYIDADAQADPDWLRYLALALEAPDATGAGGPNLPPRGDPPVAQCIARAPGGPVHVLLDNTRAEHVPGCNMAFRRERLLEAGGFDPIYRAAGDDVDVCWRLIERGHGIRFHAAAVVWHHPRGRVRDFWRQQVGYGRAEALVARNHPDKFTGPGDATWRGVIYGPSPTLPRRAHLYAGRFGQAPFQRLYRPKGGLPLRTALGVVVALALLAVLDPHLYPLPLAAAVALLAVTLGHGVRVAARAHLRPLWRMGGLIGLLHLVQPLARAVGRLRSWRLSYPSPTGRAPRFPAPRALGHGRFVVAGVGGAERVAFLEELRERLRARRLPTLVAPPWEEADLVCLSPGFWQVRMVSYESGGSLHLRLFQRLRRPRALVALVALAVLVGGWSLTLAVEALLALGALVALEGAHLGQRLRRALRQGPSEREGGP